MVLVPNCFSGTLTLALALSVTSYVPFSLILIVPVGVIPGTSTVIEALLKTCPSEGLNT